MTDTPNALEPVLNFLRQYSPYCLMLPVHQEYLAMYLEQVFYSENDVIVSPDEGAINNLYIIKSGIVNDESEGPESIFSPGDCFPVTELLQNRAVSTQLVAKKSTICYRLKQPHFDYLIQHSTVLKNFCTDKNIL